MRIVQASKAYWPHLGGIETVVKQLAEGFVERGHESVVIAAGEPPRTERHNGVEVFRERTLLTLKSVPIAPTYPVRLLRSSGDVLLIHEPSILPEMVAALASRRLHRRFRTVALWWHSDIVRQKILKRAIDPMLAQALNNVDVVLTATPHHVSSSPLLQQVADKVKIVPFGLDMSRFDRSEAMENRVDHFRRQFGDRMILFVGRLVYYKGIGELVAAMERVKDAHLVVVGDGPERPAVDASALAGSGRLTVLPPVDETDLIALFHACQAFVLPSTEIAEAFGIVQAEAMACGKPVVTFDLPSGVTWVNRHGETGLVVPLGDVEALAAAITRLLDDESYRETLGRNARLRVEAELTEPLMISRTLQAFAGSGS